MVSDVAWTCDLVNAVFARCDCLVSGQQRVVSGH